MRVDSIFRNGRIHTLDPACPTATTIAVLGGRIVAIGGDELADEVTARRVVDLGDRTVVPGFNDAHNHMLAFGLGLGDVPLASPPIRSVVDICRSIAERATTTPIGEWVVGKNYDQNKLVEGRHPTASELDAVAPRHRISRDPAGKTRSVFPKGRAPEAPLDLVVLSCFGADRGDTRKRNRRFRPGTQFQLSVRSLRRLRVSKEVNAEDAEALRACSGGDVRSHPDVGGDRLRQDGADDDRDPGG